MDFGYGATSEQLGYKVNNLTTQPEQAPGFTVLLVC